MSEKMTVTIKNNCPVIQYSLKQERGSVFLMAENIKNDDGKYYVLELTEEGNAIRCGYIKENIGLQLDENQQIVIK